MPGLPRPLPSACVHACVHRGGRLLRPRPHTLRLLLSHAAVSLCPLAHKSPCPSPPIRGSRWARSGCLPSVLLCGGEAVWRAVYRKTPKRHGGHGTPPEDPMTRRLRASSMTSKPLSFHLPAIAPLSPSWLPSRPSHQTGQGSHQEATPLRCLATNWHRLIPHSPPPSSRICYRAPARLASTFLYRAPFPLPLSQHLPGYYPYRMGCCLLGGPPCGGGPPVQP